MAGEIAIVDSRIPEAEMRHWLDATVERILDLKPERVLEIGCGTGLLLFPIAPHCACYYGTDLSDYAIRTVEQQIQAMGGDWSQVKLHNKAAQDFQGFEAETFDVVILNSVVQYFPNIDYLINVLEKAVESVTPGGHIFIGDVRNLDLLEALHADIVLDQSSDDLAIKDWQDSVQRSIREEQELVIKPAFFRALKHRLSRVSQVQVQLKRGRYHNEISRFRYDVILQIEADVSDKFEPQYLSWQEDQLTLLSVQEFLANHEPEILAIQNIPNARLQTPEKSLLQLQARDEMPVTVRVL